MRVFNSNLSREFYICFPGWLGFRNNYSILYYSYFVTELINKMCGIFAYLNGIGQNVDYNVLLRHFRRIQHRGPDNSQFLQVSNKLFLGFHRLSINGLDHGSDQPMEYGGCFLICNGEIYNWKQLQETYGFDYQSHSDCEIILHLYMRFGIEETLKQLDGVFSFVIYDNRPGASERMFIARDRYGVRGLFIGYNDNGDGEKHRGYINVGIASEAKALTFLNEVGQFPSGHYLELDLTQRRHVLEYKCYYPLEYALTYTGDDMPMLYALIRETFKKCVIKRTMSDRPFGCLLSGGLDSSLICSILADWFTNPRNLHTFSIGLDGSPDLVAAQKVADYIGSTHHSVVVTEHDFLDELEATVLSLGSYDVTTIRASVPNRMIARYVRDNSDIKVVFSGEYSDEMGSYMYFKNAPNGEAYHNECVRLLRDIIYFDALRSDHSISEFGLEARVPFADMSFVELIMKIAPELKMYGDGTGKMEKHLLRTAFSKAGGYYKDALPTDILWRRKNGFSDAVSKQERSWSEIIAQYVDALVPDEEIRGLDISKEAYYYKKVYDRWYLPQYVLTPYQWLPKWCGDIKDPSARKLLIYEAD